MPPKVPKDYIVTIEDFLASIQSVDHLNARLRHKQIDYLLFLNLNETHNGLCFILTDGHSIYWLKQYEYHDFEAIRHKLGMEGTYSGYFDILRDSFLNKTSLSLEITNEMAVIQVKYQISKGVTLSGSFDLGSATTLDKDPKVFMKINKSFLFDLAGMVDLLNKRNDELLKEMNERMMAGEVSKSKKNNEAVGGLNLSLGTGGNFNTKKDSMKQKAKTDLVNPNRKKVIAKGMKFNNNATANLSTIQEDE